MIIRDILYRHYEKNKNYQKMFLLYHLYTKDDEIKEINNYLKKHPFSMINYELTMDYNNMPVSVNHDVECNMHYVFENNRRLYFPLNMTSKQVITSYRALKKEQDKNSPHCYLNEKDIERIKLKKKEGKKIRLFECGAMEGMFSLGLIDMVDEVHIFECDKNWIDALNKTFEPWASKVHIVNKFVSDISDDSHICLNDYIDTVSDNDYLIVKMDIEGEEVPTIQGSCNVIEKVGSFSFFICTYHKQDDEKKIRELMKDYTIESTKGYFCFYRAEDYAPPFVRRCILKISK